MASLLLKNAGPGITSPWLTVRPVRGNPNPMLLTAIGDFDQSLVVEASPSVSGTNDAYQVGTIAPVGGNVATILDFNRPVERIRVKTAAGQTAGKKATVFVETSI